MKTSRTIVLCSLVVCFLALAGCGKKADETKSVSDVKAEAETMTVEQLKAKAMEYKDAVMAKKGEIETVTAKLKEIPVAQMLGEEAKQIKAEIDALNKSVSALNERFQVYYDKLKEKGGDLAGLEL